MSKQSQFTGLTLRYIWRHVWTYKGQVIGLLLVSPFTVLVNQILPPLILAHVLSRLSMHDYVPHQIWQSFGSELVAYAILMFAGGSIMWRIIDQFMWRMEGRISRDIAREVFDHLIDESANFHANHFGGSLVSQTNKLLGAYVRLQDTTIFQVLPLFFGLLFSVIILSHVAPLFALILLVFAVVYMVVSFFITRPVRVLGSKHSELESAQTGRLADAITNAMAIKSYSGGHYEKHRFDEASSATQHSLMRFGWAHQKQMVAFDSLLSGISATSLFMAVVGVMVFHANIAAVFLIFNYTANIAEQLFQFSNTVLRSYNRALGDAADMVKILNATPEILDPVEPEKVHITRGTINFKDVQFKHDGSDDAIFDGLNLNIKQGEKIGLVGHSGSGKTTFTRLLLRFSDIQAGEILIDGQNIARITQDDLRRHIAYVPQEPLLFHRSIAENIRYGDQSADMETVKAVAKMAHAADFIEQLPEGYETLVGERGVKLSGGQRQRVAIARAMLKNAPILVLDEATSALDSESEVLIQAALWKLMEGRTAIVIAHRLSTIQKMDRIIVLDEGAIVEQGSHKELVGKKDGTYAKLWAHQSGGFMED